MWGKLAKWLVIHEAILIILGVVVFLRVPSLFEPYWYGDEGIYLTIGRAMRGGMELYKEVHDNKPPLLYVVALNLSCCCGIWLRWEFFGIWPFALLRVNISLQL